MKKIIEVLRLKYEAKLSHEKIARACGLSKGAVSKYVSLARAKQKRSMRQLHLAGEKLFIDYCGPTVEIIDRHSGEVRNAQVFVSVLGASSYTYAEATYTQSLPDWIGSHQRALRFYDGVPELLVPTT